MTIICCSVDKNKLCKKLKVTPDPIVLKHYKDGNFHKDYDRQMTVSSLVNFLRDPTGDLPWEEDQSGTDVIHLGDTDVRLLNMINLVIPIRFFSIFCFVLIN